MENLSEDYKLTVMKELSIEEKAKRYESALERCRKLYNEAKANEYTSDIEDYETIFPELKESDDERIMGNIIATIHLYYGELLEDEAKEMVAWLEKQDEQKLYVNDNAKEMFIKALERVEEQNTKGYKLTDCDKNSWWEDFKAYCGFSEIQKPTDKVEPKFKIGDVIIKKHNSDILYFGSFTITDITGGKYWYNDRIICDITEQDDWELVEQKPADKVDQYSLPVSDNSSLPTFDESIYHPCTEEVYEQKPNKWSEEDIMMKGEIINVLQKTGNYEKEINWLKSLKDRVQPKQEWSEDDEKKLLCICAWIKDYPRISDFKDEMYTVANNYIDWLKYRVQPQPHWKPSDEQMKALAEALSLANNCGEEIAFDLRTLYEQLKKLREE